MNYYNEFDPFAAAWLRNLIDAGLIPQGDVDTRSITEVKADDLRKYAQCHFFAGIGGWSYALHLAGWDSTRPVWTGSCPCQPFSSAGKQKGKADERHLWTVWLDLIRECHPPAIFGEQVASAIAHGWLDDVYEGLEAEGYTCGAAVLPACSVGAPHKRDRLWFVADSDGERSGRTSWAGSSAAGGQATRNSMQFGGASQERSIVYDTTGVYAQGRENGQRQGQSWGNNQWDSKQWIDYPDGRQRLIEPSISLLAHGIPNRVGRLRGYGNAIVPQVAAEFIGAYMDIC